jgi:excisionase family DNA binding protein
VQPSELHPGWENNPGTAVPGPTTPTPNDLGVLYSGRNRLLTVREVAEQLGVCAATVYRLCERGELPHVRIVQSIRIRPGDLQGFLAAIEPGQWMAFLGRYGDEEKAVINIAHRIHRFAADLLLALDAYQMASRRVAARDKEARDASTATP